MKKNTIQTLRAIFYTGILLLVSCAPEQQKTTKIEMDVKDDAGIETAAESKDSELDNSTEEKQPTSPESLFKAEIITQPTQTIAGRVIPGPPAVKVTDFKGSPVEGVTVQVKSTFQDFVDKSIVEIESDVEGIAKFDQLIPSRQSSEHQLVFTSDKFPDIQSFHFPVVHGHPSKIVIQQQPEESKSGTALQGPPTILLTDEFGNPTPNVAVQVDVTGDNDKLKLLSGTTRIRTGYDGKAIFRDLILVEGDQLQLRFKANTAGAPQVESVNFSVK